MPRRLSRRGGGSAADVGALFTPNAPEKYALLAFETDTTAPAPYCGETHNGKTLSGWWTELLHHVLYVLNKVLFWWSK